jgi:hypothetical protein
MSHAGAPTSRQDKVMGMGAFMGYMLLFAIPVLGWIICLIMAIVPGNQNRRNFARATFVYILIGILIMVALYFWIKWMLDTLVNSLQGFINAYLKDFISNATGGAITDFDGFNGLEGLEGFGLLDILKLLGGLEGFGGFGG